jgi:hypothetical protein
MGQFGSPQFILLLLSLLLLITCYHPINFVTMSNVNVNTFTYECLLCHQKFSSKCLLLNIKKSKHCNNKVIPHHTSLFLPSSDLIIYYQNAFIVLIKKQLGFNRHFIGSKRLSIDAFPETKFVHYLKMNLLFNIVQHSENIIINFKGRMEKKDSSKYLIMNIGVFGRIPKQRQQDVLFVNYERTY